MNESFAQNMTGKLVAFAVQPYNCGKGEITKVTPRTIKVKEFHPDRGTCFIEYEVFDLVVKVTEGSEVGALWGGVPVSKPTDMAGKTTYLSGVRYGVLRDAVEKAQQIVIARCG